MTQPERSTATLIAADGVLSVMFKPPIQRPEMFHRSGVGHPYKEMIMTGGMVRGIVYERGVFGWQEEEREADFAQYCEERASKIGYEVVNALEHAKEKTLA